MRLGTTIFLLVVILITFGYVMSDDQHVRKDLKETTVQLETMNSQVLAVNQALNSCQKARQDDQQIVSAQKAQISSLNHVISGKDGEIETLKAVLAQQTGRIAQLEGKAAKLAGQNSQAVPLQAGSTWLQLDPVILVVLVIAQAGWFILQRRQRNGYVRLSAEERSIIIKLRRSKKM